MLQEPEPTSANPAPAQELATRATLHPWLSEPRSQRRRSSRRRPASTRELQSQQQRQHSPHQQRTEQHSRHDSSVDEAEHGADDRSNPTLLCGATEEAGIRAALAVVILQYGASIMSCGALASMSPEHQEPRPFAAGYADKSVTLGYMILAWGLIQLTVRLVVVIIIIIEEKWSEDSALPQEMRQPSTTLIVRKISIRLCFAGICGAPIYFIQAMYLRNAWNHQQRFVMSLLLTVSAAVEISLSGMLLLTCDFWVAPQPAREDTPWRPTLMKSPRPKERLPIQELLCHSCTPVISDIEGPQALSSTAGTATSGASPLEVWVAGDVCRGCEAAAQMQFRGLSPLHLDDFDEVQCSICLMPLEDGDVLGRLPCGHLFHKACIVTWLERATLCPMRCRHPLQGDGSNTHVRWLTPNARRQRRQLQDDLHSVVVIVDLDDNAVAMHV